MIEIKKTYSDAECSEYTMFNDSIQMGYYIVRAEDIEVYHAPVNDDFTMIDFCHDIDDAERLIIESFETV